MSVYTHHREIRPGNGQILTDGVGSVKKVFRCSSSQHTDRTVFFDIKITQIPPLVNLEIVAHGVLIAAQIDLRRILHALAVFGSVFHGAAHVTRGRHAHHHINAFAVVIHFLKSVPTAVELR